VRLHRERVFDGEGDDCDGCCFDCGGGDDDDGDVDRPGSMTFEDSSMRHWMPCYSSRSLQLELIKLYLCLNNGQLYRELSEYYIPESSLDTF
jgi:hypothetical protein